MDINTIEQVVAECAGKGLREIISLPDFLIFYWKFFYNTQIPSTMGEPLMFKDFPKIIDICKKYNVKMNLTTNGTFLGRGVHEVLILDHFFVFMN